MLFKPSGWISNIAERIAERTATRPGFPSDVTRTNSYQSSLRIPETASKWRSRLTLYDRWAGSEDRNLSLRRAFDAVIVWFLVCRLQFVRQRICVRRWAI